MVRLIIHTNITQLSDKNICNDSEIDRINGVIETNTEVTIDNIKVEIREDTTSIPITLDNVQFIAIHNTSQGDSISLWRRKNKGVMVNGFSHSNEPNTFYKEIIPKVLDKSLTVEDIYKYFPSALELSLNLLHDIYSGIPKKQFYENEIYKDLIEQANATELIDEIKEDWCFTEKDNSILKNLRDKLLTYATKH